MTSYKLSKEEKGKLAVGQRVLVQPPWVDSYKGIITEVNTYSNDKNAPVHGITLNVDGEKKNASVVDDIWLLPPIDLNPDELTQWRNTYYQRERLKKEKEREEFLSYARNKRSGALESYNYRAPKTETEWGYIWITRQESRVVSTGTSQWAKEQAEKMAKVHEDKDSYTEVVSRTVTITTSYSDWS